MKARIVLLIPLSLLALSSLGGLSSCEGHNGRDNKNDNGGSTVSDRYEPWYDTTMFSLKYEDEFDLPYLDETKWEYMIGNGDIYNNPGWGNDEQQYYTEDNTTFEDGEMVIHVCREDYRGYKYTSTRIRSAGKMSLTYGRIEARISLPLGQGLWPAFWMLPEDDTPYGIWAASGEIDIMEARGRISDLTSCALHYGQEHSSTYKTGTHTLRDGTTINDYHWYAVEWYPDEFIWYVDDDQVLDVKAGLRSWWSENDPDNIYAPFDTDFHVLINCAVGGNFDGGLVPEDDFSEALMKVDCVRMYEYIGPDTRDL